MLGYQKEHERRSAQYSKDELWLLRYLRLSFFEHANPCTSTRTNVHTMTALNE